MNKIVSFKYMYPASLDRMSKEAYSVGELLPIGISWECNGTVYSKKNENGGLCATLLEYGNVIGIVESPYMGSFNPAYILDGTNQIIWNVTNLFIAAYGKKYYGGIKLHFIDVINENETLCFIINIANCDFRFSVNIKTGEIGRLIETR
ncbi:hypothetical protein F070042J6_09150 [Bacteroides sp. f07]|uniref:hypothetical protein n=1 Tax=Bacteroides sp. f07 TaxID=3132704 RepID=UPI0034C0A496